MSTLTDKGLSLFFMQHQEDNYLLQSCRSPSLAIKIHIQSHGNNFLFFVSGSRQKSYRLNGKKTLSNTTKRSKDKKIKSPVMPCESHFHRRSDNREDISMFFFSSSFSIRHHESHLSWNFAQSHVEEGLCLIQMAEIISCIHMVW